jgi:hypothetical protein
MIGGKSSSSITMPLPKFLLSLLVIALASLGFVFAQEGDEKEILASKLLRICMDPKLEDVEGAKEVI